jgi:hypothetical protein
MAINLSTLSSGALAGAIGATGSQGASGIGATGPVGPQGPPGKDGDLNITEGNVIEKVYAKRNIDTMITAVNNDVLQPYF